MYRGRWRMYVVPVIAQHNGMALFTAVYPVQRSCLCRSFVTTELASQDSTRTLGVLDVDE